MAGLASSASIAAPAPGDLPASSISIEAEDYDFGGGSAVDGISTMPYTGDEYRGKIGTPDVDYHRFGPNGNNPLVYRGAESPDVPLIDNLGNQYGKQRPGFEVTTNFRIGWIGDGEWYNFTRTIPAGYYRAYAAISYGGLGENLMRGQLGLVTEGAGQTTQTVQSIGSFSGPGSGGWGINNLVPMATGGIETLFPLPGGQITLRFTTGSGDFDWFTLVPTPASAEPADLQIRAGGGAFMGDNVFEATPTVAQTATGESIANGAALFEAAVQNDGTLDRTLVVRAQESAETGWTVVYKSWETNITALINSAAGYRTGLLAPGASEVIAIEMTPNDRVLGGAVKTTTMTTYPMNEASDSVQAVATKAVTIQPDLVIRRDGDAVDLGRHLFNTTGAGQTRIAEVEAGQTATYQVQLLNDGNAWDQFQVTGTSGGPGWSVKYFKGRRGMTFGGGNDYVNCGNWAPGTAWTVEAWVRPEVFPAGYPAGRHGIAGAFASGADWGIAVVDGKFATIYRVGAAVFADVPITANTWYHLTGTCDGSVVRVFVNGIELGAADSGGPYNGTTAGMWIAGEACCSGNRFLGAVSDVRIWNRALTATEIQADMTQPLAGNEADLLGWWMLDDGFGGSVRDQGPLARHGTIVGGPAWGSFADPLDLMDVTAAVTGSGVQVSLAPHINWPFVVQVSAVAKDGGAGTQTAKLQAASIETPAKADAVATSTSVLPGADEPQGGTYTLNADFQKGRLVGVGYDAVPDELQLTTELVTLPFLWVPNSNEGTVSKIDTRTGRELGRYRTSPKTGDSEANPSRTTVDLYGNCWLGNRTTGTAVKIGLLENGQYVDRNGNGLIDTSRDLNADGVISGSELLPWGEDECVLIEVCLVQGKEATYVPGTPGVPYANDYWTPGPRGFAVDAKGNVWVGTYGTRKFYYLNGITGEILKTIDLAAANHTSYGALIISEGVLWSAAQDKNHVLRFDPSDDSYQIVPVPHIVYGINVDRQNHLFVSGWQHSKLSRINTSTRALEWTHEGIYESRGVAVTDDSDVWVANSGPGTVARWSNDGVLKTQLPVGAQPTGVAVDADGKVWVVNYGDEFIKRINPDTDSVDLAKRIVNGRHYGYSDMTGITARQNTTRIGSWSVSHNARVRNAPWDRGQIIWTSTEPAGTSIKVRARTSNDQNNWSLWRDVLNGASGAKLVGMIPGKFIEVEAFLQSDAPGVSPELLDLTIVPGTDFIPGVAVYSSGFDDAPGQEWSDQRASETPGHNRFLGMFGNETVRLELNDLPPHIAVHGSVDVYILGRWDGNDATSGPDIFDARIENGLVLLHTTFNNGDAATIAAGQAYPDGYPGGQHPAFTDATAQNSLGYAFADSTYRLNFSFAHTAASLRLVFQSQLVKAIATAGADPQLGVVMNWGLDNVQVNVTPLEQPPQLLPLGLNGEGHFQMRLLCDPQLTYAIEMSPDLVNWNPVYTNSGGVSQFDYLEPAVARNTGPQFYRGRRVQ